MFLEKLWKPSVKKQTDRKFVEASSCIGMFNSSIELAQNPDLTSIKSKITSFSVLRNNYLQWRKEYLLKDITTLDTF